MDIYHPLPSYTPSGIYEILNNLQKLHKSDESETIQANRKNLTNFSELKSDSR